MVSETALVEWLAAIGSVAVAAIIVYGGIMAVDRLTGFFDPEGNCANHHWEADGRLKRVGVRKRAKYDGTTRYQRVAVVEKKCLHQGCSATTEDLTTGFADGFEDGLERALDEVRDNE